MPIQMTKRLALASPWPSTPPMAFTSPWLPAHSVRKARVLVADLAHIGVNGEDRLGDHRINELGDAMKVLGVTDWRLLGEPGKYRDSGMMVNRATTATGVSGKRTSCKLPRTSCRSSGHSARRC